MDATQTTIYFAIIIASLLLGAILVFFIVVLIRNHKKNRELYKSKILAEITTLENERKRIAADLHDELGPMLAGINMKLNSISVSDPEDEETLEKAMENLKALMSKMKEISNDLMPVVLLKKGLVEAIDAFLFELRRSISLQIDFMHKSIPRLNEHLSTNIYRIIQELIHNTIKHAGANTLQIDITSAHNMIIVQTRDDGNGFDYDLQMKQHLGLGLRNMLSRTEMMGGIMYIETKKGEGTKYSFEIPL